MAELKTQPTGASVTAFIAAVADPVRRAECRTLVSLMKRVVGAKAEMWGPSIVGFGRFRYEYGSGRSNEWFLAGFSPRKNLTVYVMGGLRNDPALLARLGKHKASGGGCLYLNRLADVDMSVLEMLIERSAEALRTRGRAAATISSKEAGAKKKVRAAKPKRAAATSARKPARKLARAR
jgi:hypothetical protein